MKARPAFKKNIAREGAYGVSRDVPTRMLFLASGSCQIYNAAAASRWSPNIIPASVLSAKVNGVGGRHSSHYQLGWQRCFEQLKRLESTNNLHLLQVFGSVSCVQSSCIVRVPCMATLPNLGNVRRVVVDPTRPRGQSKLWPGWSTGKRIGVTRTILANCVVFCGGVAIPVAQEAEAVKPTHSVACGMLVNVNPWRRKLQPTKHASRTYKSLRRCAVEPQGVLRLAVPSAVAASRVAACPL